MSGIGLGVSSVFSRPGMGRGVGAAITRTTSGLVFSDDFNRADGAIGDDWEVVIGDAGNYGIVSNELQVAPPGGIGETMALVKASVAAARTEWFVQALMRLGNDSLNPGLVAKVADSNNDLYLQSTKIDTDHIVRLFKKVNGSFTLLQSASHASVNEDEEHIGQLYVADDVQQVAMKRVSDGLTKTASDTDTALNGQAGQVGVREGVGSSPTKCEYDGYLVCRSKDILVTGLETGWKAKVLDSGDSVVASATESGGTATVDCSLVGGATEEVPFAGWAALIITDGADAEQHGFDSAGVYPGDEYEAP